MGLVHGYLNHISDLRFAYTILLQQQPHNLADTISEKGGPTKKSNYQKT